MYKDLGGSKDQIPTLRFVEQHPKRATRHAGKTENYNDSKVSFVLSHNAWIEWNELPEVSKLDGVDERTPVSAC
jgi:hypothetical protein